MIDQRERVLTALCDGFRANIERHKVNVDMLIDNYSGVAEHPDLMETIEGELEKIARFEELLSVVNVHFD